MPITCKTVAFLLALALSALPPAAATEEGDALLASAAARIETHRKADAALLLTADGQALPAGTSVGIEQERHAFLFGASTQWLFSIHSQENRFETQPTLAREYARHFTDLLNFCTTQIYWSAYERADGEPQHALTQANIDWARAHGMAVKGHPLVWNYTPEPRWLPLEDLDALLEAHVARVRREVTRFPGLMWDVVNESAAYDRPDTRRRAPHLTTLMETLGPPQFVRKMYEAARDADPTAFLLTNDYALDERYERHGIAPLVNDDDGAALFDALGIQSHMHGGVWTPEKLWQTCERFARHGKPIHFTELTVLSGDPEDRERKRADPAYPWRSTPEGETAQAEAVARIYTLLFSHPAVEAITWWNFTDNQAWQGAPAGLVRADMTPKPAYERLKALVKGEWWTELETELSADGPLSFRGFLGDYAVVARTPEGRTLKGAFALTKAGGDISVVLQ